MMNNYKMIVLDMDGTLLNEEQKISKRNEKAIKAAIKKGIKVVIATGRSFKGLIPYLEQLEMIEEGEYTIACSGALAVDNATHELVYEYPIDHQDIRTIVNFCDEHELDINLYTKETLVIGQDHLFSRYDSVANKAELEVLDLYNLPSDLEVFKITVVNESRENKQEIIDYFPTYEVPMIELREKKSFNPNFVKEAWRFPEEIKERYFIAQPLPFTLEVFDKKCNKAVGVEEIRKKYGLKQDEIICVGDSGNDHHMIEYAGLGIAMGNAHDEIKAIADELTGNNNEDGVAMVIEKYFLS